MLSYDRKGVVGGRTLVKILVGRQLQPSSREFRRL